MRPTAIGIIAIIFGVIIVGMGAWFGGNVLVMLFGILFIAAGGATGRSAAPALVCPHCRESVKAGATVCPHCQREMKPVASA